MNPFPLGCRDAAVGQEPTPEVRARVLVVDDNESERLLFRLALEGAGHDVVETATGTEALGHCRAGAFDLVLVDGMLEDADGFELCRTLRALPGYGHAPIVMLTGLEGTEPFARAYEAGATDMILKTSDWAHLTGRVRFLLRNGRAMQALAAGRPGSDMRSDKD